jgi:hypothetical protein
MTTLVYHRQMPQTEICAKEFYGHCKEIILFEAGVCIFKGYVDQK